MKPRTKKTPDFSTEAAVMEYLRESHPHFFKDPDQQGLAAMILSELPEELGNLSSIQRASAVAVIMALMFKMGSAGVKCIRDEAGRSMAVICYEDWRLAEAKDAKPKPPEPRKLKRPRSREYWDRHVKAKELEAKQDNEAARAEQ